MHTHSATLHSVRYTEHVYTPTDNRSLPKNDEKLERSPHMWSHLSQDLSLCVESRD